MNRDNLRGALWMAVAACCFVTMGVAARELHLRGMNTPNIMVWRSGCGLILSSLLILLTGRLSQFRTRQVKGHVVRNSVHFVGQFAWFYALGQLPLVLVTSLNATVPLWGAIFALFYLKERVTTQRLVVIGLAFAGVLIILRPGSVPIHPAALVSLIGAMGYAGAAILAKQLTRQDSALTVVFWMMLLQLPMAFALAIWDWTWPTWGLVDLLCIAVVGSTGVLAHFAMATGLKKADVSVAMPVSYIQFPLVAGLGFALYGEVPSVYVAIGTVLIVTANWYNIVRRG
ncbi:MAG: DMT family transporter [Alphaproteobacteria bacterium]|nr:DMT family transporter [Alphaproteobacteria bacterium]MCB9930485.1 DMT family transporter [Alphaproteobacteria bacterium]